MQLKLFKTLEKEDAKYYNLSKSRKSYGSVFEPKIINLRKNSETKLISSLNYTSKLMIAKKRKRINYESKVLKVKNKYKQLNYKFNCLENSIILTYPRHFNQQKYVNYIKKLFKSNDIVVEILDYIKITIKI